MRLEDNKEPEWYCKSSELSLDDQEWIWKNVPLPEEYAVADEIKLRELETNVNVSVNGSVNDTHKRRVNFELTPNKLQLIKELQTFNYRTPPNKITQVLEEFFKECNSLPGHWLYIAQTYSPRTINWNIDYMAQLIISGRRTIENPAAYFTKTIKYRQKRKEFRNTNDTR